MPAGFYTDDPVMEKKIREEIEKEKRARLMFFASVLSNILLLLGLIILVSIIVNKG